MSHLPMLADRTARKEYRCDAGAACLVERSEPGPGLIHPGDRYTSETYPPWTLTQDDPDSRPGPLGEWVTHRYHWMCYQP